MAEYPTLTTVRITKPMMIKANGRCLLASANSRTKYVRVVAIVVPELEFINIQRKIFLTDLMECTHYTALEYRPKAFNGVGMNRACDILPMTVANNAMREAMFKTCIASPFIRRDQANPGIKRVSINYKVTATKPVKGFPYLLGS